jgi:transposase-like protein
MSQTRRTYDAEFKRNAVLMVEESGRTATEVAESLGIGVDLIYRWRREMQQNGHIAFPGQGNESLTAEQQRIKDLEKKLKDAELDRDILKKALAIFSKAPK